jgi:hypothetical protein
MSKDDATNAAEQRSMENDAPKPTYRVILACTGVPTNAGAQAALDITEEFTHRPWHHSAVCRWDGNVLILQAENDFDPNGVALTDEFSDAISANVEGGFEDDIRAQSSESI